MSDNAREIGALQPEPNAKAGRRITESFLDELVRYFEDQIAVSHPAHGTGCVLAHGSPAGSRLRLAEDGRLTVGSLRAIGVFGHVLASTQGEEPNSRALDTTTLPAGRYDVYACLTWDKIPFGPWEEERGGLDGDATVRAHRYRKPEVVLAIGDDRLKHRDFIKLGVMHRERDHGIVNSYLDETFHPFPADMRAYSLPNPLTRLVSDGLRSLALHPGAGPTDGVAAALKRLGAIADSGTPELVFTLAQECAGRLRALDVVDSRLRLDGQLEEWRFDPATFCAFLAALADSLAVGQRELYPQTLLIDDVPFTRLPGELTLDGDAWGWSPPTAGFSANAFAIYFPRSSAGEVPHLQYSDRSQLRGEFQVARIAARLSHAGTAAVMERVPPQCGRLQIVPDSDAQRIRLQQVLAHAHAIYKW